MLCIARRLTPTTFALLGVLRLGPFSAYELTKYMRRSAISQFWPRTEAAIYYETKRLAAEGLANATSERVGGRTRTVYRITAAGEEALGEWLREPSDGIRIEFESGAKTFLTAADDLDALRSQLAEVLETEMRTVDEFRAASEQWSTGALSFPDRLHHTAMAADLLTRVHAATASWAAEWIEHTSEWHDLAFDDQKAALARSVLETVANAERP